MRARPSPAEASRPTRVHRRCCCRPGAGARSAAPSGARGLSGRRRRGAPRRSCCRRRTRWRGARLRARGDVELRAEPVGQREQGAGHPVDLQAGVIGRGTRASSSRAATSISSRSASSATRSMTLRSSRTFPGHGRYRDQEIAASVNFDFSRRGSCKGVHQLGDVLNPARRATARGRSRR